MITISDVHTRKAFDIVNIYKRLNIKVKLVSNKNLFERILLFFIYLRVVHKDIKDKNFLPIEDTTIKELLEKGSKNPLLSPKESFEIAIDKQKFGEFCQENSFYSPKLFTKEQIENLDTLSTPLILKPKSGSGSVGIVFIDSKEEFLKLELDFENYIIQERLEETREVEGAFFLCKDGEVISYYGHKRIKTYPSRGGVTIHSISTINTILKEQGEQILKKLNWSGFAMIEFIYDKKEEVYRAIELNPRVWGSIMLSEFCGSNMLLNYYHLLENKTFKSSNLKAGKEIRWLIPWDIKYLLKNFYKLPKNSCYINFSYSNLYSSTLFLIYNILNPSITKKLFRKLLA